MLASSQQPDSSAVGDAKRPALPSGWVSATVETFSDVIGGGTPSTHKKKYWDGQIPWITSADIHGIRDIQPRKRINDHAIRESATNLVPSGSIIVVTRVGLGKVALVDEPLCFSQDSQGLIFNTDEIDGSYLTHYLSEAVKRFKYEGRGTTISGVTKRQLRELPVLLPPLPEQRRIVAEIEKQFSRLDASMTALKRAQTNLKHYRASVLRAACEGRLVHTEVELAQAEGHDYEPADILLERILAERRSRWESHENRRGKWKDPTAPERSGLPELPTGWTWSSLGQCFEVHVGATPRRTRQDYWNGDIAWVSSGEVSFNRIVETRETITTEGLNNSSTDLHPPGTVLLGMIGEGKTRGQVSILDIPACNSQNSAAIRVSESRSCPEYVFYHLWGQYRETREIGSGNNQPALNKSRVQEIPLPLPPLAEQRRIVAEIERRISVIQQAESTVEANLSKVERLRQSILKQAFSGKLVAQFPDDEPASALLERIRAERKAAQASTKPKGRAKPGRAKSTPERQLVLGAQEKPA